MKYLKLYENWNPLSDKDFAEARKLHKIGVISNQELADLNDLKISSKRILDYKGVGDLNLSYTTLLTGLPQGLKVGANLGLTACTGLESLPAGLEVVGDLYLVGCTSLKSLPQDLKVGGRIIGGPKKLYESWNTLSKKDMLSARELHEIGVVSDQEWKDLLKLMECQQRILDYTGVGFLDLADCPLLKSLPDGLEVGGNLNLNWCYGLESLPDGLTVSGDLSLYGCTGLRSLPAGLIVGGTLYLNGCTALTSLPADLVVDGDLMLYASGLSGITSLGELPKGLRVGGKILR